MSAAWTVIIGTVRSARNVAIGFVEIAILLARHQVILMIYGSSRVKLWLFGVLG